MVPGQCKLIEMAEEKIFIPCEGLKIEGLIDEAQGERAVIITHPHPLYGGDMYNNVVESIVQVYRQEGYTTLRFNFRGVGLSQGGYDEGIGEREDVRSALTYLCGLKKSSIDIAGYSFGAWVNAFGLKGLEQVKRMIMVSPPVNFIDFSFLEYSPKVQLIVTGSEDNIASPALIKDMIPTWNPKADFRIIEGADHSYQGKAGEIKAIIQSFLDIKE